ALDAAPIPLRPVDGFGLAAVHSAGPGEYRLLRDLAVGERLTDDRQTKAFELVGTALRAGHTRRAQGHAASLLSQENHDAISRRKMGRARRLPRRAVSRERPGRQHQVRLLPAL